MARKMARKKVTKTAKLKKTVKKQTILTPNSIETMEKSFKAMPGQITAQCRKDLSTLQQREKKLATEFKKAAALSKAIQAKYDMLAKATMTTKVKKQMVSTKKGLDKANQVIKAMTTELDKLTKQMTAISTKQTRYTALEKEIRQFEKSWRAPEPKAAKTATKKKVKETPASTKPSHETVSPAMQEMVETEVETNELEDTATY